MTDIILSLLYGGGSNMTIIYNKLVRDRIPEIIRNDNKKYKTKILDNDQYLVELKRKLDEELEEYNQATDDDEALEELADMLELIHALAKMHRADINKLERIRDHKAKERGGFKDKIFLIEVEK